MASNGKELPSRATTMSSVGREDAVPEIDPTSTAGLLAERLQAWKHAVSYLEEYMSAIEKIHKAQAKEYERALKVISHPLREGQHFDQSLGGVAGFFENMRANTQALINTNVETEKSIKGSVIPVLERLHKEIKHKGKELAHGAEKSAKEVEKARNTTQKHIELLGQQTAQFESTGARMSGHEDPYVVRRGVMHRLNKQVMEENNYRNDLISVQNNFATFEAHVIQVIQQSMESFTQLTGGQGEKTRALHSDMLGAAQRIPPDFEWKAFVQRSGERLVNPHEAPRAVESITFPNMDHRATQSLIEGSLERKSRNKLSFGYSTGYYVVTPSKFLHEFKDSDDARHDPKPELSIYLPEAVIGTPSGEKFSVKGKDKSKTISSKLTGSAELSFKAHTAADAQKWFDVLKTITGTVPASAMSEPSSPVVDSPVAAEKAEEKPAAVEPPAAAAAVPATTAAAGHTAQESGVTGESKTAAVDHATSPVDKETAPAANTSTTTAPAATAPAATVPATQPAAPAAAEVKPAEVKPAAATTATTT